MQTPFAPGVSDLSAIEAAQAAKRSPTRDSIRSIAATLRRGTREPLPPARVAAAIAAACALWRSADYPRRRQTLASLAASWNFSPELLDHSLQAMLASFTEDALETASRQRAVLFRRVIGLVASGNVIGAGLHEFARLLIAGAAVIVKSASSEPLFFAQFARTLKELDTDMAARVAVLCWPRERRELTLEMVARCDCVVALGDDVSIQAFSEIAGPRLIGFNSRVSAALVSADGARGVEAETAAAAIARDITLFEQRGCLSPHHVFVEDAPPGIAHSFAGQMARALRDLARLMPPPLQLELADAAAVRGARETVRWRKLAGQPLDLWEGDGLTWTVFYDQTAGFKPSPLFRTVAVSPFSGAADFQSRISPVLGQLEALAIADPHSRLEPVRRLLLEQGVPYLCDPGKMQSPPLTWKHGGFDLISRAVEVLS